MKEEAASMLYLERTYVALLEAPIGDRSEQAHSTSIEKYCLNRKSEPASEQTEVVAMRRASSQKEGKGRIRSASKEKRRR